MNRSRALIATAPSFCLPVAGVLAGMRAYAAADGRERIAIRDLLPRDAVGLFVGAAVRFGLGDGGQPAANIRAVGAAPAQGGVFCA